MKTRLEQSPLWHSPIVRSTYDSLKAVMSPLDPLDDLNDEPLMDAVIDSGIADGWAAAAVLVWCNSSKISDWEMQMAMPERLLQTVERLAYSGPNFSGEAIFSGDDDLPARIALMISTGRMKNGYYEEALAGMEITGAHYYAKRIADSLVEVQAHLRVYEGAKGLQGTVVEGYLDAVKEFAPKLAPLTPVDGLLKLVDELRTHIPAPQREPAAGTLYHQLKDDARKFRLKPK
jgi:hypothetical protein